MGAAAFRPEKSWFQHIFISDWTGETVKPIWMASDLGVEVESWSFDSARRLTLLERSGRCYKGSSYNP